MSSVCRLPMPLVWLAFLVMPNLAGGYTMFGHPRAGGFYDDFHGYGNGHRRPSYDHYGFADRYHDDYDSYFQPPCPQYHPIQFSDWQVAADQRIAVDVSLPQVRQQDMRVSLSSDGSSIHVKAARALPARGRACLPQGASVSRDGRYEILEADIPVPDVADGSQASMRELRGGLRLFVPLRSRSQAMPTPDRTQPQAAATQSRRHSAAADHPRPAAPVAAGAQNRDKFHAPAPAPQRSHATAPIKAARKHFRPAVQVVLPPSTGIEVEDAAYPWPEKDADAAEGWVDNRGEFQFY